jgi:tetratricopeptide (TPR) repeat protein
MDAQTLTEQAKEAYEKGEYLAAADLFLQAAQAYEAAGDALNAAEAKNNQSVALLQGGKAEEALHATDGTEEIFLKAGDLRRQGIAVANRAAAFEGMKKVNEALAEYNRAGDIFESIGEGDMHSIVRKATAQIYLKRGYVGETHLDVMDSLRLVEKPTFAQRILKFLMRWGLLRPRR